jgi:type II secretory pathway component GspD/PulD (secretin)
MLVTSLSRSESAAVDGLPGLGALPGFQTATADKVSNTTSSELIMLVTPRIVRRRADVSIGPRIAVSLPEDSD